MEYEGIWRNMSSNVQWIAESVRLNAPKKKTHRIFYVYLNKMSYWSRIVLTDHGELNIYEYMTLEISFFVHLSDSNQWLRLVTLVRGELLRIISVYAFHERNKKGWPKTKTLYSLCEIYEERKQKKIVWWNNWITTTDWTFQIQRTMLVSFG